MSAKPPVLKTQKSSQEQFADAAAKPLLLLFLLALVFFFLLLWSLHGISQLFSNQTTSNEAVNWSTQSITIAISEEPPQLNNSHAFPVLEEKWHFTYIFYR